MTRVPPAPTIISQIRDKGKGKFSTIWLPWYCVAMKMEKHQLIMSS